MADAPKWAILSEASTQYHRTAIALASTFSESLPSPKLMFRIESCEGDHFKKENDPLFSRWHEVLGQDFIPFDAGARAKLIDRAASHIGRRLELNREEILADRARKEKAKTEEFSYSSNDPYTSARSPSKLFIDDWFGANEKG